MSQPPSNPEKALSGFASLLSSALTIDANASGGQPIGDSGDSLQCFISPALCDDETCCILPSFMLGHPQFSSGAVASSVEQSVSSKLARRIGLCRHELPAIPMMMLANLSESFMTLVNSRLRSSFAALVRQCRHHKNAALPRVLVGLLASLEDPISATTIVTSFRTLPVLEPTARSHPILPLVVEIVVDLSILGELVSVKIVAPGTIQGFFAGGNLMTRVEIIVDTMALLHSMMKQARYAVRKAVAMFSNIASMLVVAMSSTGPTKVLPGFNTSTNASTVSARVKSHPSICRSLASPTRRTSRKKLGSCGALESRHRNDSTDDNPRNATWDTPPARIEVSEGLMLLTTAAGLKRSRGTSDGPGRRKKLRTESPSANMSLTRKAQSCPALASSRR